MNRFTKSRVTSTVAAFSGSFLTDVVWFVPAAISVPGAGNGDWGVLIIGISGAALEVGAWGGGFI